MTARQQLSDRIQASDYLRQCLERASDAFVELVVRDPAEASQRCLDQLAEVPDWQPEALAVWLRQAKSNFALALSVADLEGQLDTRTVGERQSEFAEKSVDLALKSAWVDAAVRKLCRDLPTPGETVPGLFVLGLGKLGGRDLNFSSDVDLIAFFDNELVPVAPMQGKADVCARVLRRMGKTLTGSGLHELIWRVDWRLRPESSATQIAMSSTAALDYYYFRSLPWHRLALLKARVVAGDRTIGEQFLHDLEPYIWRQNLDFRALEELAYLKDRIDLEHPQLVQRARRDQRVDTPAADFNLKLGTGGIREIEFIANGLQLIWGGKVHELRTGHTVTALRELAREQIIAADCAAQLEADYLWLRSLENRVQMLENMQTHLLPAKEAQQARLLQFTCFDSWDQLSAELKAVRARVYREFDSLFRPEDGEDQPEEYLDIPRDQVSDRCGEILDAWAAGFRCYGINESQSLGMKSLYQALLKELMESSADLDNAIETLHQFFKRLPPGGQYLKLLKNSPRLLHGLVTPLIYSPPMQTLLEQTPHIIDSLMQVENTRRTATDWPFDADWVLQSPDYDVRLERMRRQVNEELYQLYLRFIDGELEPVRFQELLTTLALFSLNQGLRVVTDKLGQSPALVVLGMGKLGMGRMAPMSDLDIAYLCENEGAIEPATRFVSRLQTALSTRMNEGVVYEMDTRLRPSGRSGAPTISLESFRSYQMERAKTWEHLALVASHPVAGDEFLAKQILAVRTETLTRHRDLQQFRIDSAKMLQRIREQRISDPGLDVFNTKLRPGGLMETEYLIGCLSVRLMPENPKLADLPYPQLVQRVAELIDDPELAEILQFWRVMQLWERLLGLQDKTLASIPARFKPLILDQLGAANLDQLVGTIETYSTHTLGWLKQELELSPEQSELLPGWQEQPVKWIA